MGNLQIKSSVRYVTNDIGEKTDVLVPVEIWDKIIEMIETDSGLNPIDEQEPTRQILTDLKEAVQQAQQGQTMPVSELWNDIDLPS